MSETTRKRNVRGRQPASKRLRTAIAAGLQQPSPAPTVEESPAVRLKTRAAPGAGRLVNGKSVSGRATSGPAASRRKRFVAGMNPGAEGRDAEAVTPADALLPALAAPDAATPGAHLLPRRAGDRSIRMLGKWADMVGEGAALGVELAQAVGRARSPADLFATQARAAQLLTDIWARQAAGFVGLFMAGTSRNG